MRQEWVGKRQAARTTVQLRAQMRFDSDRPPVECTINNISLTGARLTVPDGGPYPDEFAVFIPARSETKWARVRWREDLQLGVEFPKEGKSEESPAVGALEARVSALEERLASGTRPEPVAEYSARLADLERRVGAVEMDSPAAADHGALGARSGEEEPAAWLQTALERLADLEKRCAAIEQAPAAGKQSETESEARIRALESAAADLKGSLQALILLLSAQVARTQGAA